MLIDSEACQLFYLLRIQFWKVCSWVYNLDVRTRRSLVIKSLIFKTFHYNFINTWTRKSFIAKYICTYKEIVLVTKEASSSQRNNIQIITFFRYVSKIHAYYIQNVYIQVFCPSTHSSSYLSSVGSRGCWIFYIIIIIIIIIINGFLWFNIESVVMEKSKTKQFMHNGHFCKMFECVRLTKWKKENQTLNINVLKCLFYAQIMIRQSVYICT